MKRMGVTSILADESIEDTLLYHEKTSWTDTDILKFLTDGVIIFHQSAFSDLADRSLQITKMRRTNHLRLPLGMRIGEDGIEVMRLKGEPFPRKIQKPVENKPVVGQTPTITPQINTSPQQIPQNSLNPQPVVGQTIQNTAPNPQRIPPLPSTNQTSQNNPFLRR